MELHLANWRNDLMPEWRNVFADVEPDYNGLPNDDLPNADIALPFPNRLPEGQPIADAHPVPIPHMMKAFDGIEPTNVRVVVLGQDPYPRRERATGRAFEDGTWDGTFANAANSLKPLLQSAILSTGAAQGIRENQADWVGIIDAVARREIILPANLERYFDGLVQQGVLFVNAAWTFTDTEATQQHLKVWRGVVRQLLTHLIWNRDGLPVVFLLIGADAVKLYKPVIRSVYLGKSARMATVYVAHPAFQNGNSYFATVNPFIQVNRALAQLAAGPAIVWWPPELLAPAAPQVDGE